ncbi:MAG: hypothetical protein KatS3mg108_1305 [Isosphaeraceae bacterium]|jgi:hypothetical protein|nr:MAG: hypothetical protein KatS3mg108_1305 [Isosphaeraceae bacterium]
MNRPGCCIALAVLLGIAAGESHGQLIIQPAIPTGPYTTTTPYATGMVDNTVPAVVYPSGRRGLGARRGWRSRRGRGWTWAAPVRGQAGAVRPPRAILRRR